MGEGEKKRYSADRYVCSTVEYANNTAIQQRSPVKAACGKVVVCR